jgi:hypothetical protein
VIVAQPKDWDIDNGAVQVTMTKFALDIYPYHLASADRSSWIRYRNESQFPAWINDLLTHYKSLYLSTLGKCMWIYSGVRLSVFAGDGIASDELRRVWPTIMSQSCVLRIDDLIIHCVSDMV